MKSIWNSGSIESISHATPPHSCHFHPTCTAIHHTTSPPPHHIAVVPISRAVAGPRHHSLHHLTTVPPHQAHHCSEGMLQLGMASERRHQVHNLPRCHQQVPRLSLLTNGKDFAFPMCKLNGASLLSIVPTVCPTISPSSKESC